MNEFTLEVCQREIEYSRQRAERFRNCAKKYNHDDSFWHIYSDLASIFEGYERKYEMILEIENLLESYSNKIQQQEATSSTSKTRKLTLCETY
jgi:hypothetical protein